MIVSSFRSVVYWKMNYFSKKSAAVNVYAKFKRRKLLLFNSINMKKMRTREKNFIELFRGCVEDLSIVSFFFVFCFTRKKKTQWRQRLGEFLLSIYWKLKGRQQCERGKKLLINCYEFCGVIEAEDYLHKLCDFRRYFLPLRVL